MTTAIQVKKPKPHRSAAHTRRDLDPTRCICCRKRGVPLEPIYGREMPGACALCWPEARAAVLDFKQAMLAQMYRGRK